MRIALGVEYAGSQYHGWQSQTGLHTVQGCLEQALSKLANETITVVGAGRTDTGVHATGQVLHFETQATRNIYSWIHGTNSSLPKDICVRWSKIVHPEFHARYSALSRSYRYIIFNHAVRPALFRGLVTWHYRELDDQLMHQAAACLIGEKDFTSFRAIECQSKTAFRDVQSLTVTRKNHYVIINITANAFLHHMVRNIAGVLMMVGSGRKEVRWVQEVLEAKDRRLGAETAPAYGLYLDQVKYPSHFSIPENEAGVLLIGA